MVEALTGRDPLDGDDYVQLAVSSASLDRRPTPRTLGAQVSDEVESVLARAVAVKPTDRWGTAGEFLESPSRQAVAMAPMRGMTEPNPPSRPTVPRSSSFAREATLAAVSGEPFPPNSGVPSIPGSPASATTGAAGGGSGKTGLFVVLGIGALALVGGGVHFLGASGKGGNGAAPVPTASAATTGSAPVAVAPSASAPAVAACPPGMLPIPGGSFFMGSDEGLASEKPSHQVSLAPFCIDRFVVCVEAYKACSDSGRCKRAGITNDWAEISEKDHKAFDPLCNSRDPEGHGKAPHQLRRLGDGRHLQPRIRRAAAHRGRVGVRRARARRPQVSLG